MKVTKFSCKLIQSLLMKAINQAKSFVTISKKKVNAVIHFLKTPLVCNNSAWLNEQRDICDEFDIIMSCFDSAKILELVSAYLRNI